MAASASADEHESVRITVVLLDGTEKPVKLERTAPISSIWSHCNSEAEGDDFNTLLVTTLGAKLSGENTVNEAGLQTGDRLTAIRAKKALHSVAASSGAFAAITRDGSVIWWGKRGWDDIHGDEVGWGKDGIDAKMLELQEKLQDVTQIYSTKPQSVYITDRGFPAGAFSAVRSDGSVITWGDEDFPDCGADSSAVQEQLQADVEMVYSTCCAFAALKRGGTVVTWGHPGFGGDSSAVREQLQTDVERLYSTACTFAALRADGSVLCWGGASPHGGFPRLEMTSQVTEQLQHGLEDIYSSECGFAALKTGGRVVTWGDCAEATGYVPVITPASVQEQLQADVERIISGGKAFAALKRDGSVICWGEVNTSAVHEQLEGGIREIQGNEEAFAAVKEDGSVVCWGSEDFARYQFSAVRNQVQEDVQRVVATRWAFAALKKDGSVVCWGDPGADAGGDDTPVRGQLQSGVRAICSTNTAFAALKADGSVIAWGRVRDGWPRSFAPSNSVEKIYSNTCSFAVVMKNGDVFGFGDYPPEPAIQAQLQLNADSLPAMDAPILADGYTSNAAGLTRSRSA